jgi:hypothetical protein
MAGKGCYGGKEEVIRDKLLKEDQNEEMATSDAKELTKALLLAKGFSPEEIIEDASVSVKTVEGTSEQVSMNFLLSINDHHLMAIKCSMAPESRERHVLAFARCAYDKPVALCAITDGLDIHVLRTESGNLLTSKIDEFPDRSSIVLLAEEFPVNELSQKRKEMESMVLMAFETTLCPRVQDRPQDTG